MQAYNSCQIMFVFYVLSSGKTSTVMMHSTLAIIIYMATWRYVMLSLLLKSFFILFIYFHAWKKRVSSSYFLNRLNGWQTMMHCTPIHNMNKNIAECPRRTAAVPLCVLSMMWWFCGHIYISRYYLKITLIFMIICVCMLLCSPETKLFCSHLHCLFD